MSDFDIRESADRVIELLRQRMDSEAMALLERQREGRTSVLQEALDRYVVSAAARELQDLQGSGPEQALDRLNLARGAPRCPTDSELQGISEAQRFDVYASIVGIRGNQAANESVNNHERVILGLRQENSTLATQDDPRTVIDESQTRSGRGVYDDRVVVLWKDVDGSRHVHEASRANTEPTAQYDHHAGSDGTRELGHGAWERRRFAPAAGFENVQARRIDGADADRDGVRDLGRLAEGTIVMDGTEHPNPLLRGVADFSLRPAADEVAVGSRERRVQRDTNADGWFTDADPGGWQSLNDSFKIHRGSYGSTDSAGCQTIHPDEYDGFIDALDRVNQTRWQYVLTSTTPGMLRNINHEQIPEGGRREQVQHQRPLYEQPSHEQPRHEHPRGHDDNAPAMPGYEAPRQPDPRNPHHPDHPLYQAAFDRMREANVRQGVGLDDIGMQQAALSLLVRAKQDPLIRRIDEVRFSDATQHHAAGHAIVALYRPFGDREPAFGVHMETQAAARMPVERSLQTLAETSRQQGQLHGQQAIGQSNEHEAARRMI